ncbi:MAG TPA: methyltransferase domain-containing protein, partial [Solirubrobacteraceae bacterium]
MEGFRAPAAAYDRFVGRYGAELARALADFAGIRPGLRVLDVGCGPGALTAELVDRVGLDAVAAVEPSPVFAAACRERIPGVHVEEAGAEELPFPDDAFGAALAQLVVNFIPDPLAGVREMARVTRPDGVVAAAVWDYAGGMTLLRAFWDAAAELDPAAGERDEGRVARHCSREGI